MKAVQLHGYGGVDQLRYEEVKTPEPKEGEVLVKMISTSVNPVDYKMRSGAAKDRFPITFPFILGRDVAGEVVKLGPHVTAFSEGQIVMGLVSKSYAEFLTAPVDILRDRARGIEGGRCGRIAVGCDHRRTTG